MASTIDEAARLALGLPETSEGTRFRNRTWIVAGKAFAWERPLSKADIKRYGDAPLPSGPIVAVSVGDLSEKEAVLATNTPGFFTIEHFANYPAILIQLDQVSPEALREAIVDAWLACAPPALAADYLAAS